MHAHEVHTYETYACEVHAHEVHAYEVHANCQIEQVWDELLSLWWCLDESNLARLSQPSPQHRQLLPPLCHDSDIFCPSDWLANPITLRFFPRLTFPLCR